MTRRFPHSMSAIQQIAMALAVAGIGAGQGLAQEGAGAARRAAARMEDFYLLPVGDKLMEYDCLAVNTVVMTQNGDIQTCDLPLSSNLEQFNRTYLELTGQVAQTGQPYDLSGEAMVIGTSALARYDIDGAVNLYAGCYNNPFLIWGRYRRRWFRALLPISFQFHHAQLDGIPAAQFLEYLQQEIHSLGT